VSLDLRKVASVIDYAILSLGVKPEDAVRACSEALKWGFCGVCVPPYLVPATASRLRGSGVKTIAVIGFPMGYTAPEVKLAEIEWCVNNGADELDVAANHGLLKSGRVDEYELELRQIVEASSGRVVKVIVETGLLSEGEVKKASRAAAKAGADFVKTCSGFGPRGVTRRDVELIRSEVGEEIRVKASGGVRSLRQAMELIEAGADRIGTSSAVKIAMEAEELGAGT